MNHKRIYRIMKQNHLLLPKNSGVRPHRTHEGVVRTPRSNQRWFRTFEIPCPNGETVRVAFALDCYDRESWDTWPPPEGFPVPLRKKERIVGYDNEKGKGDHRHYRDREAPYAFTTVERFIEDFNADVKREEQQ